MEARRIYGPIMSELPPCPKCGADEKHVELVVIIIWDKQNRSRTDLLCKVCAHAWSLIEPKLPDAPAGR